MLMDSFEVENFRSLKHLKLEKLARVNLLVGKNNSGKTSVLESLLSLVGAGGISWIAIIEKERKLAGAKSDFRYLFYKFDTRLTIRLTAEHRMTGGTRAEASARLLVEVKTQEKFASNGGNKAALEAIAFSKVLQQPAATSLINTIYFPSSEQLDFHIKRSEQSPHYDVSIPEETTQILRRGIDFPAAFRNSSSEILMTEIDRETLSQKVEKLKFNKLEGELLRPLRMLEPRIQQMDIGSGGQIYLDLGEEFRTLLPLELVGEGVQRLLDIIASFITRTGGIVLIDEIDNGLHYSALRILWKGILQAAREYDVQVFATTHSAEALRHLTWVLDDEEYKDYRNDVTAYTLIRAKDDTVRSFRYNYEQLDFAMEHDMEVRN